jgi:hypothetical protein
MANRNVIYFDGIGYVRANLQEIDQGKLEKIGELGTNPFFVLPVRNNGILNRRDSRVFRNLPHEDDIGHEVVYGKTEIIKKYERWKARKKGEQVH